MILEYKHIVGREIGNIWALVLLPFNVAETVEDQELENKCEQEGEMGYKPRGSVDTASEKLVSHKTSVWFSEKKKNLFFQCNIACST